jgi:hypothetical protein
LQRPSGNQREKDQKIKQEDPDADRKPPQERRAQPVRRARDSSPVEPVFENRSLDPGFAGQEDPQRKDSAKNNRALHQLHDDQDRQRHWQWTSRNHPGKERIHVGQRGREGEKAGADEQPKKSPGITRLFCLARWDLFHIAAANCSGYKSAHCR